MRKLALVLFAFVGSAYGMDQNITDDLRKGIVRDTACEVYELYTLEGVKENVFSLRRLGSRMGWEGALASFIHVSYNEYHGLKMFDPLTVSARDSKEEIINALWKAFHKEVIVQPLNKAEYSLVDSEN